MVETTIFSETNYGISELVPFKSLFMLFNSRHCSGKTNDDIYDLVPLMQAFKF